MMQGPLEYTFSGEDVTESPLSYIILWRKC